MSKTLVILFLGLAFLGGMAVAPLKLGAVTPGIISYQGRVSVVGAPIAFTGTGQFRFALVNATGTTTFWSNDGTSTAGSQPTAAVSLAVNNGLYAVLLGDTSIAGMTQAIPASAFDNSDVRLRVWFNDGTNGVQQLAPDQRIASVGYAQVAANIDPLPRTKVMNNIDLTVNSTGVSGNVTVPFDAEEYDIGNMHDIGANQSRIVIPSSGVYNFSVFINVQGASGAFRYARLIRNGNQNDIVAFSQTEAFNTAASADGLADTTFNFSGSAQLNANDFLTLVVWQNSGLQLNFRVNISINKVP